MEACARLESHVSKADWDTGRLLHEDLHGKGSGVPAHVAAAADVGAGVTGAGVCDAGCGPGVDMPALLTAAPSGRVPALEQHAGFVTEARSPSGNHPQTVIVHGDMAGPGGPFDFIWSAGAVCFLGVAQAVTFSREALAPGGAIAFSKLCRLMGRPPTASLAGRADVPDMTDDAGLAAQTHAGRDRLRASRRLSDAGWDVRFRPLCHRIAALSPGVSSGVMQALDTTRGAAAFWCARQATFGYRLSGVARG